MALTDLNIFNPFTDVVGIYTPDFQQVFSSARPLKAVVRPETKLMEHPVETGATTTDFIIWKPIEIELSLLLLPGTYRDVYQTITQLYLSAKLLIVQTKTAVYQNQIIAAIPHEENPDVFDAVTLALKLREIQFANTLVGSTNMAPRKPADSNTVDRGTQQGQPSKVASSDLATIFGVG